MNLAGVPRGGQLDINPFRPADVRVMTVKRNLESMYARTSPISVYQ